METNEIKWITALEKAYDSFIMKDFSYIMGGGILLSIVDYCLNDKFLYLELFTKNFFGFFILLAFCYTFGFIVTEVFTINTKHHGQEADDFDIIKVKPLIRLKYGDQFSRQLERTTYIKHLSSSIIANSIVSELIVIVKLRNNFLERPLFFVAIGLLGLIIFSFLEFNRKKKEEAKFYNSLYIELKDEIEEFYKRSFEVNCNNNQGITQSSQIK